MAFIPTNRPHKNTEAEKCRSKGKSTTNIFDYMYTHTVQRNYLVALSLDTLNSPQAAAFSPDPSLLSSDLESLLGIPDVCHHYDKSQYLYMERFCICFYYGQAGDRLSVAFCVRYSQSHNFEETLFSYSPARCSSSSPLEIEQNHLYIHFGIAIMARKAGDDSKRNVKFISIHIADYIPA